MHLHLVFNTVFFSTDVTAGLEILAFPCNQFGGQEPGTNEEIANFVCTRFKAEYPIFNKVDILIHGFLDSFRYSHTDMIYLTNLCNFCDLG